MGIEDSKKQLKELVDKYTNLNNTFLDRKEKCDLHLGNLEAYENFRDELKSSLDKKMKTIETFRLSSQISD